MFYDAKKGQIWSSDLALSILVFSVAIVVAYMLIVNIDRDSEYKEVQAQAKELSWIVGTQGYPKSWVSDDVIRIGLVDAGALSLRKARLAASMDPVLRKKAVRTTDSYSIYFTNESGDVIGISGKCAIGDMSPASGNGSNETLLAAIILQGQSNSFADSLNDTIPYVSGYNISLQNLSVQDVILLDGNVLNDSTGAAAQIELDLQAKRGITFIIIGYPGYPVLGAVNRTTIVSEMDFSGSSGQELGFLASDEITLPGVMQLPVANDFSINASDDRVSGYETIARSDDDNVTIAKWLYEDSQVYYFSTLQGVTTNGTQAREVISSFVRSSVNVTWPSCSDAVIPQSATQVASYTRTVQYHGQLLDIHSVVWRSR